MKPKIINSFRIFLKINSPETCKSNIKTFLNKTAGVKKYYFFLSEMYMPTPNKGRLTTYCSF